MGGQGVPVGRVGTPIAAVAAFLPAEDARYLTGQNLCVDDGYTSSILGLPKTQQQSRPAES